MHIHSEMFTKTLPWGIATLTPFLGFILLLKDAQGFSPPQSIAAQAWILTAVGAGMGLVKIALWLKNQGKDEPDTDEHQVRMTQVIAKLNENDERIAENQARALENQARTLENQAKTLETINIFKVIMENQQRAIENRLDEVYEALKDLARKG